MRAIKAFTLAALAALAAMAFVGASTASADEEHIVFCLFPELECKNPAGNPFTIVLHSTNLKLLTSAVTVECDESLIELTVLNKLAELIEAHISSLSLEKCHIEETSCTATVNETGSLSFVKTGPLEASAVLVPLFLGEEEPMHTSVTIKCGFFFNCTYSDAGEPLLTAVSLGDGSFHLIDKEVLLAEGKGFLCPETTKKDADYLALNPIWIES